MRHRSTYSKPEAHKRRVERFPPIWFFQCILTNELRVCGMFSYRFRHFLIVDGPASFVSARHVMGRSFVASDL